MINKDKYKLLVKEEKLLLSKIVDKANIALKTHKPVFSIFMDPYKANFFKELLKDEIEIMLYGGYKEAERLKIGFFPEYSNTNIKEFNISTVEIKYNSSFSRKLEHKDFLGSILGLGITRDKVGDVILEDDRAIVFVDDDILEYIITNLERVAHTKITVNVMNDYIFTERVLKEKTFTVPSLRLDVVLSNGFNISRGKIADLIRGEKAFVNWKKETSVSRLLHSEDVITLRGFGRIKIKEILGTTKKSRILIKVIIY